MAICWTSKLTFEGRKLAERYVEISFGLETRQLCLSPGQIPASLKRFGIAYLTRVSNDGAVAYDVEGDNVISVTVRTTRPPDEWCVASVTLQQTTDAKHGVKVPVVFALQDSLDADRLSAAASERMDLIGQRLHGNTVVRAVLSQHAMTQTAQSDQRALARLAMLLRTSLIDKGVRPEVIQSLEATHGTQPRNAGACVTLDVLVRRLQ